MEMMEKENMSENQKKKKELAPGWLFLRSKFIAINATCVAKIDLWSVKVEI